MSAKPTDFKPPLKGEVAKPQVLTEGEKILKPCFFYINTSKTKFISHPQALSRQLSQRHECVLAGSEIRTLTSPRAEP